MDDPCKSISGDGRLTVLFIFMFGLLMFDLTNGSYTALLQGSAGSDPCEQLNFVHPNKLVVENCSAAGREVGNKAVPAIYTPLFFDMIPINSASKDMLMTVNGIGPTLAEDIVVYRQQFGKFTSSMDLLNLKGIGPKRAARFATVFTFAEVP